MADLPPDIEFVTSSVKITPASKALQEKAGSGEIDPVLIERAEQYIQENKEDFTPLALELMAQLAHNIEAVRRKSSRSQTDLNRLQQPVMQIKANGKMFHFPLASRMADIVLDFLERVGSADNDVLDLVQAHLVGLQLVMTKKIQDEIDPNGDKLLKEIEEACKRYFKKKKAGK